MNTVKVTRYKVVDTQTGYDRVADRMGTSEYIEKQTNGWPVEGTEITIDASKIDVEGKTETGFRG
jgi:hypothetical protein